MPPPAITDDLATWVQAGSTVVLVAITGWYAVLTRRLLGTQRDAPRRAAQEQELRKLNEFVSRNHQAIWTASSYFPVDTAKESPPMLLDIFGSRDALKDVRNGLLEFFALPRDVAAPVVGAAAHVLDAEEELHALGAAMTEETEAALATERRWTWSGAEAAHVAAGNDPERREPWSDILQGRKMKAAAQRWEQLSDAVHGELSAT
jgi:hypothetical protein